VETTRAGESRSFEVRHLPVRELALPGTGEVHIWFLDLDTLSSPWLETTSVEMTMSPHLARTARRFYLRLLLGAYLDLLGKDIHVLRAQRGKPLLDPDRHDSPLQFSTAASGAQCLMGFTSAAPVGVDLEPLERRAKRPAALARRYFSPAEAAELARLEGSDLAAAFLRTWACKEAVVKAAGHGIANQFCRFTVSVDSGQAPRLLDIQGEDPDAWQLALCRPSEHHLGAVASRQPSLALRCFSLEPRGT